MVVRGTYRRPDPSHGVERTRMQRSGSWMYPVVERVLQACVFVAIGVPGCAHATTGDPGQPYVPASDQIVLERLPSTSDPRVRRFDALRRQVAAKPRDPRVAAALAN